MSDGTGIGWTNATWNPVTGCSHVSPGCEHCYAETLSRRFKATTKPWTARNAAENVVCHPARLSIPARWKRPRRVFVNSMSDLFHEQVPDEFIDAVFSVMAQARQHTFQVLTKRPERMRDDMIRRAGMGWEGVSLDPFPPPNVWLGVSVEDQRRADERIPLLLQAPAVVRFVSCEPLLGPVDLSRFVVAEWGGGDEVKQPPRGSIGMRPYRTARVRPALDWVIVGGESGPDHRPMQVEWLTAIVDQCRVAGVPVFVKQDSGLRPGLQGRIPDEYWVQEYPTPEVTP